VKSKLVMRWSFTAMLLLAIARRTSPFELQKPARIDASGNSDALFESFRGTRAVGKPSLTFRSSKVARAVAAAASAALGGRAPSAVASVARIFFASLISASLSEASRATSSSGQHGEQFQEAAGHPASSVLRQYCQYS